MIDESRVARLATADSKSKPHIIPVVFIYEDNLFFIPIDKKKKKFVRVERLKRIRNIMENPQVSLIIDKYSEDWKELRYLLINGKASIVHYSNDDPIYKKTYRRLRAKYPQYEKLRLGGTFIIIKVEKMIAWRNSPR